ncbi:hypothetical protein KX729_09145 [Rhizobium sp. XQZ8]|uniref:hypothetical protein n=1 Tax=Rhizobium populisoli TaxID=2859785 RepID=UPI001CA5D476|nr:hypothetical protein [Rhizobium populisoli]MBW6421604.1 hypothetical protein [Rhizobium populisoli]
MRNYIVYRNQGATRNRPLDDDLVERLGYLQDMGVTMEVFSGGQPGKAEGGARVGSVRHDHGGAADAFFYKDGRKLDWSNKDDLPIFQQIVSQGKANGITGFGAGDGYMQKGSMHIGMGTPGVWGAGGKGYNAAPWLRSAYAGTAFDPSSVTAVAQSTGGSSSAVSDSSDPAVRALQAQALAQKQDPQPAPTQTPTPAPQQTASADTKKADEPLFKLPKLFPDKVLGVDTKKGLNVFGAFGDMIAKQDEANNQQAQQTAQAGAARRNSAQPVQLAANPAQAPLFGQGEMDPAMMEELKKKLLAQSLGGLGGLGGFGRV